MSSKRKRLVAIIAVLLFVLALFIALIAPTITFAEASFRYFDDTDDPAVLEAASLGIVHGYEGRFRPTDNITRAEWATMLYNAFCDSKLFYTGKVNSWWDAPAQWLHDVVVDNSNHTTIAAEQLMDAIYAQGGSFDPHEPATAAFVTQVLYAVYIHADNEIDWTTAGTDFTSGTLAWLALHEQSITPQLMSKLIENGELSRAEAVHTLLGLSEIS